MPGITQPQKLMVCLKGKSNTGKTGVILALAHLLIDPNPAAARWNRPNHPKWQKGINVEINCNGRQAGLDSEGDSLRHLRQWLPVLTVNYGPNDPSVR
jgi:hypothetical protein